MSEIYFYKGQKDILAEKSEEEAKEEIQKELLQVFDVKNLSFLFGAGCSSHVEDGAELGIPVMAPMAEEYYATLEPEDKTYLTDTIKIDITYANYKTNLEKFLEVLFSYKYLMECRNDMVELAKVQSLIQKTKEFIFEKCTNKHDTVIGIYEQFYKKLVYRDKNLTKTNIFTTNYDLFNERALDQLGIIFSNGFSGVIDRYFNPAVFNYAFAEQMDLSNNKWNVIDNFIYLYKLHGSISWIEDEDTKHLFKIKELQEPVMDDKNVMIYPTPVKQNASFGSPYSDLFREFQKKLMVSNNILITVGYSFSDEHINNLIYQALTIPAFRLIIIGNVEAINIKKLFELNDPRIWIIGEKEQWEDNGSLTKTPIHFFKRFVEEMLPSIDQENIEKSVQKVLDNLFTQQEQVPNDDS
jgi:hypothetical protein